jgi:hypothetical protein
MPSKFGVYFGNRSVSSYWATSFSTTGSKSSSCFRGVSVLQTAQDSHRTQLRRAGLAARDSRRPCSPPKLSRPTPSPNPGMAGSVRRSCTARTCGLGCVDHRAKGVTWTPKSLTLIPFSCACCTVLSPPWHPQHGQALSEIEPTDTRPKPAGPGRFADARQPVACYFTSVETSDVLESAGQCAPDRVPPPPQFHSCRPPPLEEEVWTRPTPGAC